MQWAAACWTKIPCWCQKLEENGQYVSDSLEGSSNSNKQLSRPRYAEHLWIHSTLNFEHHILPEHFCSLCHFKSIVYPSSHGCLQQNNMPFNKAQIISDWFSSVSFNGLHGHQISNQQKTFGVLLNGRYTPYIVLLAVAILVLLMKVKLYLKKNSALVDCPQFLNSFDW